MANIPLADFPNAPSLPAVPPGTAAPAPNINFDELTGVAGALLQDEISGGALNTFSQGLNQLAKGIGDLGEFPGTASAALTRAKNEADLVEVENILAAEIAAHQAELQAMPDTEYVSSFERRANAVTRKIRNMPLGPQAREKADLMFANFQAQGVSRFSTAARLSEIKRGKQAYLTKFEREFDGGNYERASSTLSEMTNLGFVNKEEEEAIWQGKSREMNRNLEAREIAEDPHAVLEDMGKAVQTGYSEVFAREISPLEASQVESAARQRIRQNQFEASEVITQGILTGEIISEEQIREMAQQSRLSEEAIKAHTLGLKKFEAITPKGIAAAKEKWVEMRALVAAYDPTGDPDQKQMFSVMQAINAAVPEGYRRPLLDALYARRREGQVKPREQVRSYGYSRIKSDLGDGFFGTWETKEKGGKTKVDFALKNQAATEAGLLLDAYDDYLKQHPEASFEDAGKWIDAQMKARRESLRAQSQGQGFRWYNPWTWGAQESEPTRPAAPLPSPEDIKRSLPPLEGELPSDPSARVSPIISAEDIDLSQGNDDLAEGF